MQSAEIKHAVVPLIILNAIILAAVAINPIYAMGGLAGLLLASALVRSPEMLFALIINGYFLLWLVTKPFEKHNELTLLVKFLVLAGFIVIWWRHEVSPQFLISPVFISTSLLGLFMLYGVKYSGAPHYGLWKTGFFFVNNIFAIAAAAFICHSLKRVQNFFFFLMVFGIVLAVSGILQVALGLGDQDRLAVFDITPIWISRGLGLSIIVSYFFYMKPKTANTRFLIICTVALALAVMLLTKSRAPILALFVTVIFYFFYFSNRTNIEKFGVLIVGALSVIVLIFVLPETLTERFFEYGGRQDVSGLMRLVWFKKVLPIIADNYLFGIGTGGFGKLIMGIDMRAYPHNIFVEIGLENGLIGLGLFLAFLFFTIRRGVYLLKNTTDSNIHLFTTCAALVLVFGLLNALFSGDSPWNEQIWLSSGIILGLYTYHRPSLKTDTGSNLLQGSGT